MTKTLADMTPEESDACVGMWCDGPNGRLVIYCRPNGYFIKYADVTSPNNRNHSDSERFDQLTPRFDLPRAWNPDGTPVKGEWVDGHMWWNEPGDDSQPVDLVGAECLGTGETQGMDKWPENVTPAVSDEDIQVRRFITEWENTND